MNQIVFAAGVLLFPAVCTTLGAAGVFLLRRSAAPRTQRVLSGMAAGIMLAASVWSLLLPAIERTRELGVAAWVPPSAGLVLGAAGLLRLESMAGQLLQRGKSRMVLAVTLHNLPEGMVVGLAAALALSGEPDAVSGALALSLGIGLQNIPEGAAVSLPLAHSGRTRLQAFGAGAASGLVEPLGALAAFALAGWVQAALPWLMSAAAGCMVCVTAQEMIPEAVEQDEPAGVVSIVLGFALMMALDVRYFSELTNMAVLTEEVGELARIMARKYGDQSFKEGEKCNLADEMADVLWVLTCLANQTGVDLTAAMEANFAKKTSRDKERHLHNPKL